MTRLWRFGDIRGAAPTGAPRPLVVKVGGSLLCRNLWPQLLDDLIAALGDRPLSVVVGGGRVVDGLRDIDAAAPQPARVMHELAIDAMHLTAQLVSRTTGLPLSSRPAHTTACVLDVPLWLLDSGEASCLPVGWDVTSDSIAARVAVASEAELILAKSVPPPASSTDLGLAGLAEAGWVDRCFPGAAADVARISWAAPHDPPATSAGRRRAGR